MLAVVPKKFNHFHAASNAIAGHALVQSDVIRALLETTLLLLLLRQRRKGQSRGNAQETGGLNQLTTKHGVVLRILMMLMIG